MCFEIVSLKILKEDKQSRTILKRVRFSLYMNKSSVFSQNYRFVIYWDSSSAKIQDFYKTLMYSISVPEKALSLWGGGSSLQLVRIEFRPCFVCETLAFWRVVEKNSHHRGSFIFATSFNTCATAVYKQQCSPLWSNCLQSLTESLIQFILLHIRIHLASK